MQGFPVCWTNARVNITDKSLCIGARMVDEQIICSYAECQCWNSCQLKAQHRANKKIKRGLRCIWHQKHLYKVLNSDVWLQNSVILNVFYENVRRICTWLTLNGPVAAQEECDEEKWRQKNQPGVWCLSACLPAWLTGWLADLRSATVCAPAPPSHTHGVIKLHFWVRRFGVGQMVLTAAVAGPGSEHLQRCHTLMEGQCRTFTSDRAGTFCLSIDQVVKREGGTWCPLLDPELWLKRNSNYL